MTVVCGSRHCCSRRSVPSAAASENMRRVWLSLLGGVSALLLSPSPARAQSPQQVNNWNGGVSLPADVSMNAYVPGKVAPKPPLLRVIHYCGGSAQAVFNQA